MKHTYIDSLLSEIQLLESKVANLKRSQHVPFSFFKESFKRTQEISRLLHELEFVQIEDMKGQMERLVQFLSEAQEVKGEVKVEVEPTQPMPTAVVKEDIKSSFNNTNTEEVVTTKTDDTTLKVGPTDDFVETHKHEQVDAVEEKVAPPIRSFINQQKETIVDHLGVKNKSLNDVQPVNQTIQDAKRSISLNDRFLFQRELFDNNREAMNTMMSNLQPFTSFDAIEHYLKENTNWNFEDETVDKFMQMLKDSFR